MLKKVAVAVGLLLAAALMVPVFASLPSVDVNLEVNQVELVAGCEETPEGQTRLQTWEVDSSISVTNTSEQPVKFASTGYFAKFNDPNGSRQISYHTDVIDADGFVAGTIVGAGQTGEYQPVVRVGVSCAATAADLFSTLRIEGRDKTYLDGDAFIANGTPVPIGPTGIVGVGVTLGFVGFLAQRLSRRPRPVGTRR